MQGGGQGRGASRQGFTGRGVAGRGVGVPAPAIMYGGIPGAFTYGGWGAYSNYNMPGYFPPPPVIRPPFARGAPARSFVPLGVQGAGILKRPAGPAHGHAMQGRGHNRGHGGRNWGKSRKNLTKEALDADLDEWRMKDKKFGGQSLDADLDEYWKKKQEDGDDSRGDVEGKEEEPQTQAGTGSSPDADAPKNTTVGASQTVSHGRREETPERSPAENGTNAA